MIKEVYMEPKMEITYFEVEDVITTSNGDETGDSPLNIFDLKM